MAQTAAQLINLACQIARVPSFTAQGGALLNIILQELCQNYDFDQARKTFTFNFNSATGQGTGPYTMPADYLRAAMDEAFYTISGVPYTMISIDLAEYDKLVLTAGFQGYPQSFATDPAQSPVALFVWPPASGSYPVTLRYYTQMADIATPETSAIVPWFPDQNYLLTRLSGELMKVADDERMKDYLGDSPTGAQGILNRYLKLANDDEGRAKQVQLDRRRFGRNGALKNTKAIGW